MSDYKGAASMFDAIPDAKSLLSDKGYYADWFRIEPCIPPKSNRKAEVSFDPVLYKSRHKIENMFGKFKDWRRVCTRYDRCAHTFITAIAIAAPSSSGSIN
jgi:transposase